jgi:catechol 2,3-dioxygenase-like lactoylglutathione lyase family enzyme
MNPKLHISLDVHDLNESVRFYSTLFNSQPTKLKPGYAKFDLNEPAVNLTMQERSHCCLQGLSHLGIRVESTAEVQKERERLRAAGIPVREETSTVCCHALQDKIWVADPTGYKWEIYVFRGDVEESDSPRDETICACR